MIGGFSVLLDNGISELPEAIPGMDKSASGFFIMSFFSSLGEFLVTKNFFASGNFVAGAENIAFSNAINIGLAKMAMATSYFKHSFFKEELGPETAEGASQDQSESE